MYLRIYKDLKKEENKKRAKEQEVYHKYDNHVSFGIDASLRNSILKKYKKDIRKLECKELLANAEILYGYGIEETVLAGNFMLKNRIDCVSLPFLDKVLSFFCSWSTVDDFCINILQPVLKNNPEETLRFLQKWNRSKNMWKRRSSVVVFTRKIGESGEFTKEALSFCEKLIWDKEDMVQKGVGWCLKDVMRGNKKKVLSCVKKLRERGVSSTITLYAIREVKGKERRDLLQR